MKDWRKNRLLPGVAKSALFTVVLAFISGHVNAQDTARADSQWYQIDLIVFKPKNTDISQESWPASEVAYPADVLSIFEPDIFKLEQLEQLEQVPTNADEPDTTTLQTDEFAFQGRGNQARNRRIIESVTTSSRNSGQADNSSSASTSTSQTPPSDSKNETDATAQIDGIAETSISEQVQTILKGIPYPVWDQAYADTKSSSSLTSIASSLNRSSRFTVLSHHSWVQPIQSENQPVMIQTGKRYDDQFEVEGTLSFSRSRFLHVDTNLWYTHFQPRGGTKNPYRQAVDTKLDPATLKKHADLVEIEKERGQYYPVEQYLMTQSRRMRSDELHYIDHPLIGLVIRINRFERPNVAEDGE